MRVILQIVAILAFYGAGDALAHLSHSPLPGSVVGIGLILLAFRFRLLRPEHLREGALALLGRMLLFFVPAVPAIIDHPEFFGMLGVKLLLVVVCGTLMVMAVTGMVVQMVARQDYGDG